MKRLFTLLLFFAPLAGGQTVNIQVQNQSFEELPVQDPKYQLPNAVETFGTCYNSFRARSGYPNELPPNWYRTYNDPVWGAIEILQPLFATDQCDGMQAVPDGSWLLYLESSTIVNELSAKPSDLQRPGVSAANGLYTMSFWITNYDTVYPGYYEVGIWFGILVPVIPRNDEWTINGHELCSTDGWAKWHFAEMTLTCESPNYLLGYWPDTQTSADPNAHLILSLSHSKGWPVLLDKISLTFTPTN